MARRTDRESAYEAAHALESTPTSPTSPARPGRRVADQASQHRSFAGSIGWALAGTVLPGLGLTRTRWRVAGIILLVLSLLLAVAVGLTAWLNPNLALAALVVPTMLTILWVAAIVFGVVWAASIVVTHLALRPRPAAWWQRLLGGLLVGAMVLGVATPSFGAARAIRDTSLLINDVFGHEGAQVSSDDDTGDFGNAVDPWANKDRLNVLVLGGDAGADRTGTRTDTVILASMDTHTGDTVLFSLPRQTQKIPFPAGSALAERFPQGFTSGRLNDQAYALNAIYDSVPQLAPEAIPAGVEDPGAEALKLGVGAALGLKVDYYAMVNMQGFVEFVNALGGITVNINRPVPVGGRTDGDIPPDRWLPPGPDQHLNGEDALWFARGRYGIATGDYDRMSRQRCVIQAVVKEANPTTVLANYEALSRAGREIVNSDVPNRRLPAMVALALRVKDGTMTSVSFENDKDGFSTSNPDWELVRARVQDAIRPAPPAAPTSAAAPATPAPGTQPSPAASGTPSPRPSATPSGSPTPAAPSSVVDECAYNPEPYPTEEQKG